MGHDPIKAAWLKELEAAKQRVNERFDSSPTIFADDAFIEDATLVFCSGLSYAIATGKKPKTPEGKAAFAIAQRLTAYPDMEKEWRVSFPFVWLRKDQALTNAQLRARALTQEVMRRVKSGEKPTSAIAHVADEVGLAYETVRAAYYRWLPIFAAIEGKAEELESLSKNSNRKIE